MIIKAGSEIGRKKSERQRHFLADVILKLAFIDLTVLLKLLLWADYLKKMCYNFKLDRQKYRNMKRIKRESEGENGSVRGIFDFQGVLPYLVLMYVIYIVCQIIMGNRKLDWF